MQCSALSCCGVQYIVAWFFQYTVYMHSTFTISSFIYFSSSNLTISPSLRLPFVSFLHLVSSFYLPPSSLLSPLLASPYIHLPTLPSTFSPTFPTFHTPLYPPSPLLSTLTHDFNILQLDSAITEAHREAQLNSSCPLPLYILIESPLALLNLQSICKWSQEKQNLLKTSLQVIVKL